MYGCPRACRLIGIGMGTWTLAGDALCWLVAAVAFCLANKAIPES